MAMKTKEKVGYQEEVVVKAAPEEVTMPSMPVGQVREAAEVAAEAYAPDEVEKHAEVIAEAWMAKLNQQAKDYKKQVRSLAEEVGLEATDIVGPAGYTWWNLLLAGPFQAPATGGPYLPSKVIRAGEPAFMLAVIRRNPAAIPGTPISAAILMQPYSYSLWLQTINLTNVTNGPDVGPIVNNFGAGIFGFLNYHIIPLNFPMPPEGTPYLYETNMLVDITNANMPFAGFNTWILDPDTEPAIGGTGFWIFSANLGGWHFIPGLPGAPAGLQHDTPARFMVYHA